ncbi:hypothetical protein K0M31_004300 [Melipona bicolor]|uniref:Uncharacterized protein n=1 Tax=Melipona bicolor TaxID=60889 RepID=A0AA40FWI3_9HYME|nr:hypothetical protein K0M31_004300 [Melipona bicolor]
MEGKRINTARRAADRITERQLRAQEARMRVSLQFAHSHLPSPSVNKDLSKNKGYARASVVSHFRATGISDRLRIGTSHASTEEDEADARREGKRDISIAPKKGGSLSLYVVELLDRSTGNLADNNNDRDRHNGPESRRGEFGGGTGDTTLFRREAMRSPGRKSNLEFDGTMARREDRGEQKRRKREKSEDEEGEGGGGEEEGVYTWVQRAHRSARKCPRPKGKKESGYLEKFVWKLTRGLRNNCKEKLLAGRCLLSTRKQSGERTGRTTVVPSVGGRVSGERTRRRGLEKRREEKRRWRRWWRRNGREKNDNHRHFNNMQRYSRLPRRASVATMALYNDKDTPGRLGTFRSTKGAALGSSYRTGTCFVRRGQMSPIMSSGTGGDPDRRVKITAGTENILGERFRNAAPSTSGDALPFSRSANLETLLDRRSRRLILGGEKEIFEDGLSKLERQLAS